MWPDAMIFVFWVLSFKPAFSLSSLRLFSSSLLSAIRVESSACLKVLVFLPAVLIPACASSSPEFLMMSSACAVLCLVPQSHLTLCDPVDCSPPGSSVHGILQARILEWVAMPSSRESRQPRNRTQISCIAGGFFTIWSTCIKLHNTGWQYTALTYSFPNSEPVLCSVSSSNCCFLTRIQASQEADKVVWYSYLLRNFPQVSSNITSSKKTFPTTFSGVVPIPLAILSSFFDLNWTYYFPILSCPCIH